MEHQFLRELEHIGMKRTCSYLGLEEHVKRFRRSGKFYNISLNFSDEEITNAIIGICKKNKIKKSCYIRPFYFVGDYGINLACYKGCTH